MRKILIRCLIVAALIVVCVFGVFWSMGFAGFWKFQVAAYEKADRIHPPPQGAIVFTGSSSIAHWHTLENDMKPLPVINRGFGGAQIAHVNYYAPKIVLPYHPRAVVLYAGDNDLSWPWSKTPEQVLADFKRFIAIIKSNLSETWIYYVSIKPTPIRAADWPKAQRANALLKQECESQPRMQYIDIDPPMLDAQGKPRPEIFRWDGLHMNTQGYVIWTSIIKPILMQRFGAIASLDPANPSVAAGGGAAEHDDLYSSDVSSQAGPGSGPVKITTTQLGVICPTLLLDKSGHVVAYCRDIKSKQDSLRLLDPSDLSTLASLDMPAPSGKMGGFYMYETQDDDLVLAAGNNHVLRVAHSQENGAHWQFKIANDWDVSQNITAHCGSSSCDYLESVMPDFSGKIWFSSEGGVVGTVDPKTGTVRSTPLPEGEHVANSISSSPAGVAVATDHALYLLSAKTDGAPNIVWREPYALGTKTKASQPGQATGSSPVFFGGEGHPYLAVTDNGDTQENLLVYRVNGEAGKRQICKVPLFSANKGADGNTLIGYRNGVVLSNNFGFDYGSDSGKGLELLPGGLTRIDVRDDASGCDAIWTNSVRAMTVPKLSAADGRIYMIERAVAELKPQFVFTVIDYATGVTLRQTPVGESYTPDKSPLTPLIGPNQTLYQPTSNGIIKISPENPSH